MIAFTVFHTVLSLLPVGFGFAAFVKHQSIDPATRLGKLYIGSMFAASVSSFGFIAMFGFTPGQVLTLLTLGLLAVGTLTLRGHWRKRGYTQAIALSTSYLLLMVFATTETLKQVPVGKPFATGPTDPALVPVRLALLAMFVLGVAYQVFMIRAANRPVARLERVLARYRHAA